MTMTLGEALRQVARDDLLVADNAFPPRDPLDELADSANIAVVGEAYLSQPVAIVPGAIMAIDEQGYQSAMLYTLVPWTVEQVHVVDGRRFRIQITATDNGQWMSSVTQLYPNGVEEEWDGNAMCYTSIEQAVEQTLRDIEDTDWHVGESE